MVEGSLLSKITGKGDRSSPTSQHTPRTRRFSDADSTLDDSLFKLRIGRESKDKQTTPEIALQDHRCTSSKCAAMTVLFELPELLEIVLNFLNTDDVLNLRRVSRCWNDTIHRSPILRLHHFVHPNWSLDPANFQLLDPKVQGLSIKPGEDVDKGTWVEVTMTSTAARSIRIWNSRRVRSRSIFEGMRGGLGRRDSDDSWPARATPLHEQKRGLPELAELQIMRPPILGMQAFVVRPGTSPTACSSEPGNDEGPSFFDNDPAENRENDGTVAYAKLHCDAGITLGFLADTVQSLLMDDSFRPESVEETVVFKGIVSFTAPAEARRKRGQAYSVIRLS